MVWCPTWSKNLGRYLLGMYDFGYCSAIPNCFFSNALIHPCLIVDLLEWVCIKIKDNSCVHLWKFWLKLNDNFKSFKKICKHRLYFIPHSLFLFIVWKYSVSSKLFYRWTQLTIFFEILLKRSTHEMTLSTYLIFSFLWVQEAVNLRKSWAASLEEPLKICL